MLLLLVVAVALESIVANEDVVVLLVVRPLFDVIVWKVKDWVLTTWKSSSKFIERRR